MLDSDESYLYFLKKEYLREQKLLDKIISHLIDEVKVNKDLLESEIRDNGKDFEVLRHIYKHTTNNEDFDEIVEKLKK